MQYQTQDMGLQYKKWDAVFGSVLEETSSLRKLSIICRTEPENILTYAYGIDALYIGYAEYLREKYGAETPKEILNRIKDKIQQPNIYNDILSYELKRQRGYKLTINTKKVIHECVDELNVLLGDMMKDLIRQELFPKPRKEQIRPSDKATTKEEREERLALKDIGILGVVYEE